MGGEGAALGQALQGHRAKAPRTTHVPQAPALASLPCPRAQACWG